MVPQKRAETYSYETWYKDLLIITAKQTVLLDYMLYIITYYCWVSISSLEGGQELPKHVATIVNKLITNI
jgi:hypothetical protein